ncbi:MULTISPECIES: hypothetical protein [unclassified Clostridium]|uniref:hypothetical protein n=1 Tax=unclassified Clostridium TaxID=2614128 RepID=UPI0025C36DEB|nr:MULTISPECIES: hypothetical protein [unclassified Clostridium]
MNFKEIIDNYAYDEIDNIFDISVDDISSLCNESSFYKNNVFYLLQHKFFQFEKMNKKKELAYVSHLVSFHLFIILTPVLADELAFSYAEKSLEFDSENVNYKEWILFFNDKLEEKLLYKYAEDVLEVDKGSVLAKRVLGISID